MKRFKRPVSKMTSMVLQKIFKASELSRTHFFPKKVPSLSLKEPSVENSFTQDPKAVTDTLKSNKSLAERQAPVKELKIKD